MTLMGVDVSKWQGTVDWAAVQKAGIAFAIDRATIGTTPDPTFAVNRAQAAAVGILPGAYHYLVAGDPAGQADAYVAKVGSFDGILAALDCEAQGLTFKDVEAFVLRFRAKTADHPIFIYTGIAWWHAHGNPAASALGPLWLAFYPGGGYPGDASPVWDTKLGDWPEPTLWQYGPSTYKKYDGDAYRGSKAELSAYASSPNQGGPNQDMGEFVTPFAPIPFAIAGSTRSWTPTAPYVELDAVSGTLPCEATVYINQTAVPHGPFVRIQTGTTGRRLVAAAAGVLGAAPTSPPVDCSGPVAAEHERTRQQAIAAAEAIP